MAGEFVVTERDVERFARGLKRTIDKLSRTNLGFIDKLASKSTLIRRVLKTGTLKRKIVNWKREAIVTALGIALDEYEAPEWLKEYTVEEVIELSKIAYNRGL